jgi:hypothetical protein
MMARPYAVANSGHSGGPSLAVGTIEEQQHGTRRPTGDGHRTPRRGCRCWPARGVRSAPPCSSGGDRFDSDGRPADPGHGAALAAERDHPAGHADASISRNGSVAEIAPGRLRRSGILSVFASGTSRLQEASWRASRRRCEGTGGRADAERVRNGGDGFAVPRTIGHRASVGVGRLQVMASAWLEAQAEACSDGYESRVCTPH